ncbi:MAG: NAD(P)-dependent alcohol dehydrogenase [Saonia sp.]
MKSLQLKKYGDVTEVLQFKEAKQEIPKDNEVLVEVKAVGLNPIDIKIAKGDLKAIIPSITKKPKLGFDISGVVNAKGGKVISFQEGDEVFARLPLYKGSGFSEFVIAKSEHVAKKPNNVSFEEAASIPLVGLTCIQALKNYAKGKSGQSILIDSGSGGVGTFAIQYAKHIGLDVTAVTSHKNEILVESLGADRVICYELLEKDKAHYAIEVFKWNIEANPESANVYDSLGETYLKTGQNTLALKNYKMAFSKDPKNKRIKSIIEKLEKTKQ